MTLSDTLEHLKALGDDKVRTRNSRNGAGDNQYGVKLSDIRKVAKTLKSNHQLAIELWKTGNIDARFLATLVIEPEALSAAEMDRMVRSVVFVRVADWLNSYVVRNHPAKETLRQAWMISDHPMAARFTPAGSSPGRPPTVRSPASAAVSVNTLVSIRQPFVCYGSCFPSSRDSLWAGPPRAY